MTTQPRSLDQTIFHPNRMLAAALRLLDLPSTVQSPHGGSSKSAAEQMGKIKAVDALALAMQEGAMGG
jgi:hypothetical protein